MPHLAMPPLSSDCRALTFLVESANGCNEAIMLAHGFTPRLIANLVRAGLATARAEHLHSGGRAIELTRLRITAAGRRALAVVGR
jgi:hypothetical protein